METAGTETGIADDTEDSDISLLVVNDAGDDNVAYSSDGSNVRIPDSVGTASNPAVLEMRTEGPGTASEAESTQDAAVVVTRDDDVNCSRGRWRRSHRHHRSGSGGRRRHRLCRFKRKESNYLSATCHVIVVVLMCIALTEPRWFIIRGGRCSDAHGNSQDYLGVKTFMYQGAGSSAAYVHHNAYFYGNSLHDVLLDCVTPDVLLVLRVIIALCFVVIIICLNACLMDVFGPTHVVCRAIRYTASLSVLSACACVVICGLCYLITRQLTDYYSVTPLHAGSKILVQFNIAFYIITSAAAVSIIGVACTLMRRVRHSGGSGRARRHCLSSADRRRRPPQNVDSDIERLAAEVINASCPPTGRMPPPYRR